MDSEMKGAIFTFFVGVVMAFVSGYVTLAIKTNPIVRKIAGAVTVLSVVFAVFCVGIFVPSMLRGASEQSQQCIRPEVLAQQKGWGAGGITNDYGGLFVDIASVDTLPPYWEATGPRDIKFDDPDRSMVAGHWTIYTPYSCREELGFRK